MPTISVRISDEERRKLLKYGPVSETVRDAIGFYLTERKKREFVRRLKQFQAEHPVKVDPDEIVRIVREGRQH